MRRTKDKPVAKPVVRPVAPALGGTAEEARRLEAATARLSARRDRDRLPHRIASRRLVLRAPIRGDVPALVALADNRAIADKLARLPSPYTRADGIAFVEIFAQRPDERPYAIILDGSLVGVVGLTFHGAEPPELGYWLGEPHWGKGLMSEAVAALLEAASAAGFSRLIARALIDNAASLAVLERAGFHATGKGLDVDGRKVVLFEKELRR